MDILGNLVGTTASALSGGLFGLVGNVASKVLGYFEAKQEFAQKQAEWAHDIDLQKLQMQASAQQAGQQLQVAQSQGEWNGLAASVTAEGGIGASYPWVEAVRSLTRPTLTLGLTAFLAAAFFALTPGDIDRAYVADSLVFAAVTSIVWWFGDRAPKKKG